MIIFRYLIETWKIYLLGGMEMATKILMYLEERPASHDALLGSLVQMSQWLNIHIDRVGQYDYEATLICGGRQTRCSQGEPFEEPANRADLAPGQVLIRVPNDWTERQFALTEAEFPCWKEIINDWLGPQDINFAFDPTISNFERSVALIMMLPADTMNIPSGKYYTLVGYLAQFEKIFDRQIGFNDTTVDNLQIIVGDQVAEPHAALPASFTPDNLLVIFPKETPIDTLQWAGDKMDKYIVKLQEITRRPSLTYEITAST